MSKVTSEEFLKCVEKSRLVESMQLTPFVENLRRSHDPLPDDPVALAKLFEDAKLLTRWHCEKLLQGKYKGFFLGKHKLLGHLGTGGMSTVYLAEHVLMHSKRAVKVLPKSKLGNNSYLQRFQQEAKAIASLNHPNIIRAYDIDNDGDTHYLVMEYVDGYDLQTLVRKKGPLEYSLAAEYILQSAKGLQHAHENGLIHRDVKPANLFLSRDGIIKVLDLGLAMYSDESRSSVTMEHNDKVLGTADYLAPEQALNSHNIDARADIYGLGCSLYYLLTGHAPFPSGSIAQRIAKHQTTMPEEIRKDRADCPGELDGICVKMMQKDRRFRYRDCNQVAEVLEAWLATYRKTTPIAKATVSTKASPSKVVATGGPDGSKSSAPGSGSSVHGGPRENDTVSNRGGDTMGGSIGPSSGSMIALSASDSGALRAIALNGGSDIGSKIDLEHDTNRPNPHRAIDKPRPATKVVTGNPLQNKAIPLPKSVPAKPVNRQPVATVNPHKPQSAKQKPTSDSNQTWLPIVASIVVGLLALSAIILLVWLLV
jgi:eukaryotic-like serine/threonine-protein kinase